MDNNIIDRISEELQEGIDAVEMARDTVRNILNKGKAESIIPGSIVRFSGRTPYVFVTNTGGNRVLVIDLDTGTVSIRDTLPTVHLPMSRLKFAIADYVGKEESNA